MERARIVFAIEGEMSTEERDSDQNKYWTNIDDERYLQVEQVDESGYREDDEEEEDKKEGDSKKNSESESSAL